MELEHLPTEILHHICLFVRDDSFHDLSSLSRTSRTVFSVASPIFYRNLIVHWNDKQEVGPEVAVAELHNSGLGRHYLKYARQLDIICHGSHNGTAIKNIPQSTRNVSLRFDCHRVEITDDEFLEPYLTEDSHPGLSVWMDEIRLFTKSQNWKTALITLLKALDRLVELNYHMKNTFPMAVLGTLEKHQPLCKLNIWGNQFVPGGHNFEPTLRGYIEPFEIPLFASPILEAFTLHYPWKIERGSLQYIHGGYLLALAHAPNLKHLRVNSGVKGLSPILEPGVAIDYFDPVGRQKTTASTLESLSIFGGDFPSCERILLKIAGIFDLSRLRSLDISLTEDMALLRQVAPTLQSIQRLSVMRDKDNPKDIRIFRYESRVLEAVLAFRPLEYLRVQVVWSVEALKKILLHQGRSLRGLAIQPSGTLFATQDLAEAGYKYPPLDSHEIREMAKLCPYLTELSLPIKRSSGDYAEWDMYRALGEFSFLHTLILDLQCDPREHPLRADVGLPHQEIFINGATDEALVTAIWDIVSSNQLSKKLRNLRCTPFGQPFYSDAMKYVLSILGKSFLVRRLDFKAPNHLEVTVIAEEKRHERIQDCIENMVIVHMDDNVDDIQDMHSFFPIIDEEIDHLLYGIWPGINWRTSWHSFPLEGSPNSTHGNDIDA